jgi:ferric-dicitrate binding protein FerR (iron transport regulator)
MVTVYLFKESFNSTAEVDTVPEIVNTKTIEPGTNKATLTLGDGSQIVLEKDIPFQTTNANSDGNQIIYKGSKGNAKNLVYNYLTIARGEQFHIVLSDGTKVWLNSESQLKYPVNFIKGETRQVELLYGEAYFDVSPSTAHYGAKFKVKNNVQEVEVLGTEFNIKAYKDETNIYTTLVEGKVSITAETKNKILKPSQQLNLNLINKTLQVSTVNVHYEISWKDGVFSFRRKPLEEIVKVLSRWYDVDFVFDNEEIKKAGFNGNLSKEQKLEDILETIKSFGKINEYEINHKTVILK